MSFFMKLTMQKKESQRNLAEEDEQIENCLEKQPVEYLQQDELPQEWRIPRDLSVENIIGQIQKGVSTR